MDYENLLSEIAQKFESVKAEAQQAERAAQERMNELLKLQGEYRIIERLKEEANNDGGSRE